MGTDGVSVVDDVERALKRFRFHQRWWLYMHYFVGLIGILGGGLATRSDPSAIWGALAAVSTGVVTFLGPQQKGERYKQAEFHLVMALAEFKAVPSPGEHWLVERFKEAMNMVIEPQEKARQPPGGSSGSAGQRGQNAPARDLAS
jgi:hypothetical protein